MKRLLISAASLLLSVPLFGSDTAKVAITVSGSPCTGGPTNCAALVQAGTIQIESVDGETATAVQIDSSGLTVTALHPKSYRFRFDHRSPVGQSPVVTQDVVDLGEGVNLISLQFDTGIR